MKTNKDRIYLELKHRLFTSNLLMVRGFNLHPALFCILLLIEYLQLCYFAFFSIQTSGIDWDSPVVALFLMNYQKLIIEQSITTMYIVLYLHLVYYLILIGLALGIVGRKEIMRADLALINGDKEEENKNDKHTAMQRILSICVLIGQEVLVIPTFQLLASLYTYKELSQNHIIITAIATFLAIMSLSFLALESLLFQNPDIKAATIPWRGMPSRIPLLKLTNKVACVMFSFKSLTDTPIASALFLTICCIVLFKRYHSLRVYNRPYLYWLIFSESTLAWFALWNFLQKITDARLTVFTLGFLIIGGGLIPYYLAVLNFYIWRRLDNLMFTFTSSERSTKHQDDVSSELYFGYLIDLVKTGDIRASQVTIYGLIRTHWYQCKKRRDGEECLCQTLVQKLDLINNQINCKSASIKDAFDMLHTEQAQIYLLEQKMRDQDQEELRLQEDLEIQQALEQAEMKVKQNDTEMQTIIQGCSAAAGGDLETLEKLLNVSKANLNRGDYDNRTPLHLASATGHIKVVQFLIEKALVIVSPTDRWGATPLNDAKIPEITIYLKQKGGFFGVQQKEYQEMISANVSDEQCRLYFAAFNGDIKLIQNLFFLGTVKVNDYDYDGRTALSIAASEGHLDPVKFLVVNGADCNHKDARNNTALDDAKREKQPHVVQFLEKVQRSMNTLQVFLRTVCYDSGEVVQPLIHGSTNYNTTVRGNEEKKNSPNNANSVKFKLITNKNKQAPSQDLFSSQASLQSEESEYKRGSIKKKVVKVIRYEKELKTMLYRFVYEQLDEQIGNSQSLRLKYMAAYMQYQYLRNDIKALFQVLQIERLPKVPFEWQFFMYKAKADIEDRMDSAQKKLLSEGQSDCKIDVKQVYLFASHLQDFVEAIDHTSEKCLDFWRELLKKADFNPDTFHQIGTQVTHGSQHITRLVNSMLRINPHYGYLLRTYSFFLYRVLNNEEDSDLYIRRCTNSEKTFIAQEFRGAPLMDDLSKRSFSGDFNFLVVVLKVQKSGVNIQNNSIVEDINHEVREMLGYRREEIRGKHIAKIMPRCIGDLHDQFVKRYLDTAETRFLNQQREVFILRKNGYLMQAQVYATVVPVIEKEGLKFIGFIKRVDERTAITRILPPPTEFTTQKSITFLASPNGNILGLSEQAQKILSLPSYFAVDSDENKSEYNLQLMIKNYNTVLLKCFKYSPIGQIAIIDTEVFKANLLQDLHSRKDLKKIEARLGRYQVHIQATPVEYGNKDGAYLPIIVVRMYVMARLQKVDKSFLAKRNELLNRRNTLLLNAGFDLSQIDPNETNVLTSSIIPKKSNSINSQTQFNPNLNSSVASGPASGGTSKFQSKQTFMRTFAKIKGYRLISRLTKGNNGSIGTPQLVEDISALEEEIKALEENAGDVEGELVQCEDDDQGDLEIRLPIARMRSIEYAQEQEELSKSVKVLKQDQDKPRTTLLKKFSPNKSLNSPYIVSEENDSKSEEDQSSYTMDSNDLTKLKEFRKMVNSQREPSTVIFLRRLVLVMTALMFAILSVETALKMNFYQRYESLDKLSQAIEEVQIDLYQVYAGFRTIINIHNDIQPDEIPGLAAQGQFSVSILDQLSDYLIQLNRNKNIFLLVRDLPENVENTLSKVTMQVVQSDGTIETQHGNLHLGLGQLVAKGNALLNSCTLQNKAFKNRTFIEYINQIPGYSYKYGKLGNEIEEVTKNLYFLENNNVFDSFTSLCETLLQQLHDNLHDYVRNQQTIGITLVCSVLVLTLVSAGVIFRLVRQTESARIDSLSLYSELHIPDVHSMLAEIQGFVGLFREDNLPKSYLKKSGICDSSDEEELIPNDVVQQNENLEYLDEKYDEGEEAVVLDQKTVFDRKESLFGQTSIAGNNPVTPNNSNFLKKTSQLGRSARRVSVLWPIIIKNSSIQRQSLSISGNGGPLDQLNQTIKNSPLSKFTKQKKPIDRLVTFSQLNAVKGLPSGKSLKTNENTRSIEGQMKTIDLGVEPSHNSILSESSHSSSSSSSSKSSEEIKLDNNVSPVINEVDAFQESSQILREESDMSQRRLHPPHDDVNDQLQELQYSKKKSVARQEKQQKQQLRFVPSTSEIILPQEQKPELITPNLQDNSNIVLDEKVGNVEKFKQVTSTSGFRTLTAVALIFVFPLAFVAASVSLSIPFYQGLQESIKHKQLVTQQFTISYSLYLQVMTDLVNGYSQKPQIMQTKMIQKGVFFGTPRSQYDLLLGLKFESNQELQDLHFQHLPSLDVAVQMVQSLDTNQYCSEIQKLLQDDIFNATFCETIDKGVAKEQGFHIQLERILGEIAKIRNAFEQRPLNLTEIFYQVIGRDYTLAKFQIMMDRLFTPTFYGLSTYLQTQLYTQIALSRTLDQALLSSLIVLHILVILCLAWPRFLTTLNANITQSRGILNLVPSRLVVKNKELREKMLGSNDHKQGVGVLLIG